MISAASLPAWTAILNTLSFVLLLLGFYFIRQRNIAAHKRCMIAAFASSILFLCVYLLHHWLVGIVYFKGMGWRRTLYLWTLGTHTPLAAIVPVLAIITLRFALRGKFAQHKRIAQWTLPIWLYVSVTGVAVYWMLYRW